MFLFAAVLCCMPNLASAYEPATVEFVRARVSQISESLDLGDSMGEGVHQDIELHALTGPDAGETISMTHIIIGDRDDMKIEAGEVVILQRFLREDGNVHYSLQEKYRLRGLMIVLGFFLVLGVGIGRKRGFMSMAGLAISIGIILFILFPLVIAGWNPLLTSIAVAFLIASTTVLVSHGCNQRTLLALIAIYITLIAAIVLAIIAVHISKLYGLGSEESIFLQFGGSTQLDLRGVFLAGIIIGTLGVLDDVTTAQIAAVHEVSKANPSYGFRDLYRSGTSVGHEHVASMINTLALAYVGASLPLLLLFFFSEGVPVWVTLNSAFLAEEIVRILVGSSTLLLAVPVATWLAAQVYSKRNAHFKLQANQG